jgi:hypothetical protein
MLAARRRDSMAIIRAHDERGNRAPASSVLSQKFRIETSEQDERRVSGKARGRQRTSGYGEAE